MPADYTETTPYTRAELLAMDGRAAYAGRVAELREELRSARNTYEKRTFTWQLSQVRANFRRAYPAHLLPS